MSSPRQLTANRANGALSRGPVTAAGKQRSAMNAITHGLLARAVVLGGEDSSAFQALVSEFCAAIQPANTLERTLVEELAASTWRQRRCWALETRAIDLAAARNGAPSLSTIVSAYTELADGRALDLFHRYETRLNRMFQRALKNILVFRQNMKFPNEPNPEFEHSLPQDEPQDEVPEPEPVLEPEPEPAPLPEPTPLQQSRDSYGAVASPVSATEPAKRSPAPAPWTSSIPAFHIP